MVLIFMKKDKCVKVMKNCQNLTDVDHFDHQDVHRIKATTRIP